MSSTGTANFAPGFAAVLSRLSLHRTKTFLTSDLFIVAVKGVAYVAAMVVVRRSANVVSIEELSKPNQPCTIRPGRFTRFECPQSAPPAFSQRRGPRRMRQPGHIRLASNGRQEVGCGVPRPTIGNVRFGPRARMIKVTMQPLVRVVKGGVEHVQFQTDDLSLRAFDPPWTVPMSSLRRTPHRRTSIGKRRCRRGASKGSTKRVKLGRGALRHHQRLRRGRRCGFS